MCGVIKRAFLLPLILLVALTIGTVFAAEEAYASTLSVSKVSSTSKVPSSGYSDQIYWLSVSSTSSKVTYTVGDSKLQLLASEEVAGTTYNKVLRTKSKYSYSSSNSWTFGSGASDPAFTIYVTKAGYTSDGQYVDLKVTFNSIKLQFLKKASLSYYINFFASNNITKSLWLFVNDVGNARIDVTYTIYYTGTTTKVKNYAFGWYVYDIDEPDKRTLNGSISTSYSRTYAESILFYSGFGSKLYLSTSTYLTKSSVDYGSYDDCTKLVGSKTDSSTFKSGFVTYITSGSWRFIWWGSQCGTKIGLSEFSPEEVPIDSPVKTVDKEEADLGDTLTYTITETIPYTIEQTLSGDDGNTYSKIVLTDTLDDAFDPDTVSVTVYRENTLKGTSKKSDTSNWTVKVSGQKVTVTANDPTDVGGNYTFVISAQLKEDADLTGYNTEDGCYLIENSATMRCGSYSMTSETVSTKIEKINDITDTSYTERIISVDSSDDSISYTFDGTTAEEIYEGALTSYPYEHTTSPNNTTDDWTISAEIATIEVIHSYKENEATGEITDEEYTYNIVNTETVSRTFKYSTVMPTISQEKYTPLNLNRNGYATSDDIDSSYVDGADGEIQAEVNNKQSIEDDSDLTSLDINLDSSFYFAFTNSTFGMPDKYNWANTPDTLEEGSYEYVEPGASYANGKNDNADEDGYYRYNLKFYASISSIYSNADTASLVIDDDEYTSSSALTKTYASNMNWRGGTMYARFIYQGLYTTDNNNSDSSFANWWIVTYSQGKFYEYGTSFEGLITVSTSKDSSATSSETGIQDATVSHGTYTINSTTKSGTDTIVIDANNEDRGLYVGLYLTNYEQPILYGHWSVATMAGTFRVS